jgi:hypothetical protein
VERNGWQSVQNHQLNALRVKKKITWKEISPILSEESVGNVESRLEMERVLLSSAPLMVGSVHRLKSVAIMNPVLIGI